MNSKAKRRREVIDQRIYTSAVMGAQFHETRTPNGRKVWLLSGDDVTWSVDRLLTARRIAYGEATLDHEHNATRWVFKQITPGEHVTRYSAEADRAQALSRSHRHQSKPCPPQVTWSAPPKGVQAYNYYNQARMVDMDLLLKSYRELKAAQALSHGTHVWYSSDHHVGDSISYGDAIRDEIEAANLLREANKDEAQRADRMRERDGDRSISDARRLLSDRRDVADQSRRILSDQGDLVHGRTRHHTHRQPNDARWAGVPERRDRHPGGDQHNGVPASTKGEEDCPRPTQSQAQFASAPTTAPMMLTTGLGTITTLIKRNWR